MKKIVLIIALIALNFGANAQDGKLSVGGNIGVTIIGSGDPSFVIGGDVDYLFNAENRFNVGVASGFIFIPEGTGMMFPIAGAFRVQTTNSISLGLDMGYAIWITHNSSGGFYFRPIFEYKLQRNISLRASYSGIGSEGYLNAGVMFSL